MFVRMNMTFDSSADLEAELVRLATEAAAYREVVGRMYTAKEDK